VSDNSPPDVTNKNVSVFANINSPKFKLFADFSHGEGSESNKGGQSPAGITAADWEAHLAAGKPGDPHFIYTLERSGQKSTGNKLDFKFTFDLTDYLFADKITDINSATIEQILEVITTKDIFLREGTQPGNEFAPQMKVDVAVTVSQAPLAELYKTPTPGATPAPASN
jgi:hypothetical protein